MNYSAHSFFMSLWLVMIFGEWCIALLALRKIRNTYPAFTLLVSCMAFKSSALILCEHFLNRYTYFYLYYRTDFIITVLQIAATVEVFSILFRPYWTVPRLDLAKLLGCSVAIFSAIARLHSQLQVAYFNPEVSLYLTMERVACWTTAMALAIVLLFSKHFEMPYRSRLKGIACGLYVMAVTQVIQSTNVGFITHLMLAYIPLMSHIGTLSIWFYFIEKPEALVAELEEADLTTLRAVSSNIKIALGNTPTSCGLTVGKRRPQSVGKEKAKAVINL